LKYITKCRVCPKEFSTSPFDIPIIGQPNQKVITYVTALMKHLQSHPEQMAGFAAALQEFSGLLCVSNFDMQDPQLIAMAERIRARTHRFTRRNIISDAMISDRLSQLPIPADILEPLTGLFQDMRDVLLEEGRYAPKLPETTLVTP
jgi:hypothetical protein